MRQFLSFFRQFLKPLATSNTCIFVSIAWKMNCDILKSKLILCEWNAFYFIEIAFIGFTLQEIKQCIVFFGTPGIITCKCLYALDQNLTKWKSKADACVYHDVNLFFVDPPCFTNSFSPGKATSDRPNDRGRDSRRYIRRAGGKPVCRRCQE